MSLFCCYMSFVNWNNKIHYFKKIRKISFDFILIRIIIIKGIEVRVKVTCVVWAEVDVIRRMTWVHFNSIRLPTNDYRYHTDGMTFDIKILLIDTVGATKSDCPTTYYFSGVILPLTKISFINSNLHTTYKIS